MRMTNNYKTKIVRVEAQQLRIHPTAQRQILPSRLKTITANLDLDAIGVLHAVEYAVDGQQGIYVIDGQHRLRALMDLGLGEWVVEVKIHVDAKDDASASDLFLKLNDRSPVTSIDKFENEVRAGYGPAVSIVEMLRKRHLEVARTARDGAICCVAALKRIYQQDEGKSLPVTLDVALSAWGHRAEAMEGKILEGLSIPLMMHGDSVDRPALVKKLAKYPGGASGLLGDALGLRKVRKANLARCVAEVIAETYNSGKRTGRLEV